MAKIRKEQKIMFANAFMKTRNGLRSLDYAGLPQSYDILLKLLNDDYVNSYIEEYTELAEIYDGNTRDGHVAELEELFKFAVANKKFQAVTRLSERLEKLKGWDKQGTGNEIVVDLKLSNAEGTPIDIEPSGEREDKVFNHFKKEGLL